jgi:hypothetical protein
MPEGRVRLPAEAGQVGSGGPNANRRWLRQQVRSYRLDRAFWEEAFGSQNLRLYITWYRNTQTHCAMADAMEQVGGVTAVYQRSYETHPSVETTTAADIMFAFGPGSAWIESESGSSIPYYLSVGYLGDHRFPLLRESARLIRRQLEAAGARRIVAFGDENSRDDARWHTGHDLERDNYGFLLERLLAEPDIGLVIKPKTPHSLRRRLGPVAKLLAAAESTGRCIVFQQGGRMQGAYPPAAAALAADVMIHGHLNAVTAGLDAALAGVPTLLVDRVGWHASPLYELGVGRVVFTDWNSLWQACREQWNWPGRADGFGDWGQVLDRIDPFRDGRAAERMGSVIGWLIEGFRAGLPRETVMADAVQRFAERWGKQWVGAVEPSQRIAAPELFTPLRAAEPVALGRAW